MSVISMAISVSNRCFVVSLMDSLDSTVGTAQREKIKQIRHRQIDVPVSEDIGGKTYTYVESSRLTIPL